MDVCANVVILLMCGSHYMRQVFRGLIGCQQDPWDRGVTLGGGAISWASKKHTYITHFRMESKFIALDAAGKEAECLKSRENLIF